MCVLLQYQVDCEAGGGVRPPQWDSCDPRPCTGDGPGTGVEEVERPGSAISFTVMPNPFAQTTLLQYRLDTPGEVRIDIYDASGRCIRQLLATPGEVRSQRLVVLE